MKKYSLIHIFDVINFKFNLKMKLTTLLLFIALFQINANTYSQKTKVSLNLTNSTIEEVFNEIEKKTEFNFFYKNTTIDLTKRISINVKKQPIKKILDIVLENSNITYEVLNKQIIIIPKIIKPITVQDKKNSNIPVQQKQLSGTITDENEEPLPGATVIVKGANIGTSADFNGNYSLAVPNDATTLVITYIGYKTTEVEINNRTTIDVQLKPSTADLDEVVLIGYGKVKKEALTGSVAVVDIKSITNQAPTINLDNALQGQVAGVYVSSATGQPGAAARVRIRGTTSLLGSNQPLYVIDGIPVVPNSNIHISDGKGGALDLQLTQQGLSTPLGNINSADIESISILKDASAAAIYGSRAANGVIIINTKQGIYSGAPQFNVDFSLSTQNAQTLDVLNAAQFKQVWTTAVENGTSNDTFAQSVLDGSYFGNAETNWEDEISPSNPVTTTFNIGVFGGSKKTRYNTSLGVNTQDGVYEGSAFDRYSYNLNIDTEVSSVWKFGSKINISFTDQKSFDRGLTNLIYQFRPDIPVYDDEGNFSFSPRTTQQNPVALAKGTNTNKTLLLLGSFYTRLKLAEGLHIKTLFALNYNNGNQQSFFPKFTNRGGWHRLFGDGDGYSQEARSRFTNTLFENTLTFDKSIGLHTINSILGVSFEKSNSSNVKAWGEGYFNNVLTDISSATVENGGSSFESESGLSSYFGRVNYDFNDKYLVTLSARIDGSSKFAVDNKYAFFPAAAVAWRISNEAFLEDNDVIDELKLRISIGKTGQQDFGNYAWRTLYSTNNYANDPSIILTQLGHDKLKWETTDQFDLGLDFSLLNNKISGSIGYYTKHTKDALFTAIPPGSAGFSRAIANLGNTKNTGIEFELKTDIIRTDNFNWNLSFNISKNKNELTKISDDFKDSSGFLTGFGGGGRLREGDPIGLIYGYASEGIFQTQAEIDALNTSSPTGTYQHSQTAPGDLKFRDITGSDGVPDGRITNLDQQVIGDTQPDFFGGINNTLSYKGFTLSTFFTYSIGNDLDAFALARNTNFANPFFGENKVEDVLNTWTPQNTNTNIPRSVYRDPNNNGRISSHYVYDASYLRLKTLNLSYSFSAKTLKKIKFLNKASIFITGQNLLTITNYPGADPEASSLYNNDINAGRDNNRFPIAKVFTAGVRIGF